MAAPSLAFRGFGLFSDEVFSSTDLNRRSAEVLNHASKNPVTISRKDEWFALLRRDQAANLFKGLAQATAVFHIAQGAIAIKKQNPDAVPACVAWMKVFDDDERLTMLSEVFTACVRASEDGDWDNVDCIVHQWRESAMVIQSGVLKEAMDSERDEQPIPDPRQINAEEAAEPVAEIPA